MPVFIDRRLNPKDKSLTNRHRFLRRVREDLKRSIRDQIRTGKIADVDYLGALARYDIDLPGGARVRALSSLQHRAHAAGETVGIAIEPEHCRIL